MSLWTKTSDHSHLTIIIKIKSHLWTLNFWPNSCSPKLNTWQCEFLVIVKNIISWHMWHILRYSAVFPLPETPSVISSYSLSIDLSLPVKCICNIIDSMKSQTLFVLASPLQPSSDREHWELQWERGAELVGSCPSWRAHSGLQPQPHQPSRHYRCDHGRRRTLNNRLSHHCKHNIQVPTWTIAKKFKYLQIIYNCTTISLRWLVYLFIFI